MTAATATKSGPIENKTTHFRTQMVNGKPQIYFEDILDESSVQPQVKQKRNSRMINTTRLPPEQPKPKPTSQKPVPQNIPNKQPKKTNKVIVNQNDSSVGVFMTMEEIAELVKAVKDAPKGQNNSSTENNEVPEPPPPPQQQQQQQPQYNYVPPPAVVSQLDLPQQTLPPPLLLGPTSPREEALGMMADKKRRKWMREKAEMDRMRLEVEYDQLKHQLTPVNQKSSLSPERTVYPSDFSSMNKPSGKQNDNPQNDFFKTGLMEKKQQQWRQENAEKAPTWDPFGRPGAGAPNINAIEPPISQPSSNNMVMPYRQPDPSLVTSNIIINDQTHVPAAMRTNLLLGNVRFEDDVKIAKEMERRQWLDDLQRQIEDNKRKKFTQQETERRQDFLHENVQPIVQEASNRHQQQQQQQQQPQQQQQQQQQPPQQQQQQQQQKAPSPTPSSNPIPANNNGHDTSKIRQRESLVQQTYDKILEATELAKYEKKQQLIEKLKRNGHKTDLLAKTLPDIKTPIPDPPSKIPEKNYDSSPKKTNDFSPKKTTVTKIEPIHLNTVIEQQPSYRTNDTRRDEAVNTIDSTFRSDNGVQTDLRMVSHHQMFNYTREESDLPPQVPNHLLHEGKQNKKNVRIRSHEDNQRQRQSNNNNTTPQANTQRNHYGPHDLLHRPLWNYQNGAHRQYVPNSKRDPNSDKRQKPNERTTYNRWNSDSELQHERKEKKTVTTNQPRSNVSRQNQPQHVNLPKGQPKEKTFVFSKNDDESNFNNVPSLDKYEHFIPYTRTDEILDPARAFSPLPQSREPSARNIQPAKTNPYDDHHRRSNVNVQAPPYHVPPAQQQHILQQLTAIKENLVRRQQEVATSMNAIPV
ncbi:unnamed protein product [Adineta steineri]|uniref:Uncharacterized protein n=1 Tax=Adineta steineri TaxID=433720 RepID=A0A820A4G7_9BILA|nr:unnamed protein product [Adineta steineri]